MKDRIKFNDAMLAAVMDGRKTQTRRPMKVQPVLNGNWWEVYGAGWGKNSKSMPAVPGHSLANNCPYGQIGDIINLADKDGNIKGKIEITDVWLQQIQEISPSDAMAEGISAGRYGNEGNWLAGFYIPNSNQPYITAKNAFKELWQSIYGEVSWISNEWVWVIEFKEVE
ncbi:ASCH domain-containing protein [Providencia rettgeri]|uniref:ASCH domain-containing protein n=1 Tax=Providencia rettgeri TaxID=587 RepID=UPI00301AC3C9